MAALMLIRWILLVSGVAGILVATILFRPMQRWMLEPYLAAMARRGLQAPPLLRNERFLRLWNLLMGALLLAVWWYLGTEAGSALLRPKP